MTRWQKNVTLKAIRENKVPGFDCGFISTPSDMVGKMERFRPCWNVKFLADGTQEFFDTGGEGQTWIRSWDDISR